MARPSPRPAPVTSAVRPSRSKRGKASMLLRSCRSRGIRMGSTIGLADGYAAPRASAALRRDLDVGEPAERPSDEVAVVDHVRVVGATVLVGDVEGVRPHPAEIGEVAPEHVATPVPEVELLMGLVPVREHRSLGLAVEAEVADELVVAALGVAPAVGEMVGRDDAAPVEEVPDHRATDRALLDVDVLGGHVGPETVADDADPVAAVGRTGARFAVAAPVAERRSDVDALTKLWLHQARGVDRRADDGAVRCGLSKVDALLLDVMDQYAADEHTCRMVDDDALLREGDGEADEAPVAGAVEPHAVGGVARRARGGGLLEVVVDDDRVAGAGQRDRRGRRAGGRGERLGPVLPVGHPDCVARLGARDGLLEL